MGRHSRAEPDGRRVSVARLGGVEARPGLDAGPLRHRARGQADRRRFDPGAAVTRSEGRTLPPIPYSLRPRGPVLLSCAPEAVDAALAGLRSIAVARHSVAFTIDPAWEEGVSGGRAGTRRLPTRGQRRSGVTNAMIVPLEPSEAPSAVCWATAPGPTSNGPSRLASRPNGSI